MDNMLTTFGSSKQRSWRLVFPAGYFADVTVKAKTISLFFNLQQGYHIVTINALIRLLKDVS